MQECILLNIYVETSMWIGYVDVVEVLSINIFFQL